MLFGTDKRRFRCFWTGIEPASSRQGQDALTLLSYQIDNRNTAARPRASGKYQRWNAGFEPARRINSPVSAIKITDDIRPENERRTRSELDFTSCLVLRDLHPLILQRGLNDNPNSSARLKNSMDKRGCGQETGRQVSNLHLPDSHPGALSLLSYIRNRFL